MSQDWCNWESRASESTTTVCGFDVLNILGMMTWTPPWSHWRHSALAGRLREPEPGPPLHAGSQAGLVGLPPTESGCLPLGLLSGAGGVVQVGR
jgi:hypothetical protein